MAPAHCLGTLLRRRASLQASCTAGIRQALAFTGWAHQWRCGGLWTRWPSMVSPDRRLAGLCTFSRASYSRCSCTMVASCLASCSRRTAWTGLGLSLYLTVFLMQAGQSTRRSANPGRACESEPVERGAVHAGARRALLYCLDRRLALYRAAGPLLLLMLCRKSSLSPAEEGEASGCSAAQAQACQLPRLDPHCVCAARGSPSRAACALKLCAGSQDLLKSWLTGGGVLSSPGTRLTSAAAAQSAVSFYAGLRVPEAAASPCKRAELAVTLVWVLRRAAEQHRRVKEPLIA